MFIQAYINTAREILRRYDGNEPFNSFLKKYFKEYKKFGSRDRKQITHLCYCFFRLGKSLDRYSVEDKFAVALFLCSKSPNPLLEKLNEELNKKAGFGLDDKIKLVQEQYNFNLEDVFPWRQHTSGLIEFIPFVKSFFIQPDIFLRIRPGKKTLVEQQLDKGNISFQLINDYCISIAPSTKLDEILEANRDAVVQDLNSQKVFNTYLQHLPSEKKITTTWDCCAASGGKAILLKDQLPNIELTVSDIRESILVNLRKRFQQAGIKNYKWFVADITAENFINEYMYDVIICDAPCSGSGTWSRTPEQLYFFDERKISQYSTLQKKIVSNAVKSLRTGGFFVYITCSVFKNENEELVRFIKDELSLHLINSEYLKGYQQKADTLFAALFSL